MYKAQNNKILKKQNWIKVYYFKETKPQHFFMKYEKLKQIAKGWSSYIWLAKIKGKIVVLKEVREKSNRKNLAKREGEMLAMANSAGIGPQIIEVNYKENFVVMEFIEGQKFFDFVLGKEFEKASKEQIYHLVKELFRQCIILDKIGLRHTQLQVGKNILIKTIKAHNAKEEEKFVLIEEKTKFVPVIIDFEKASVKMGCHKNVGQLLSMLFYNPNGLIAKKVREKLDVKL